MIAVIIGITTVMSGIRLTILLSGEALACSKMARLQGDVEDT